MTTPEQPLNPLPPVIILIALAITGVEIVFQAAANGLVGGAAGIGWRLEAVRDYAFSPRVLDAVMGGAGSEVWLRFLAYAFVQPTFTSALFAVVMVLALGKFVGEQFSAVATVAIYFGSVLAGAVVFGLVLEGPVPLIGAFPGIYGLIGAYTYVLWLRYGQMGEAQIQAFRLIGVLLGLQLLFGMLFGAGVTWIAEIAGFVTGFAVSPLVSPGGWQALRDRLRQR